MDSRDADLVVEGWRGREAVDADLVAETLWLGGGDGCRLVVLDHNKAFLLGMVLMRAFSCLVPPKISVEITSFLQKEIIGILGDELGG